MMKIVPMLTTVKTDAEYYSTHLEARNKAQWQRPTQSARSINLLTRAVRRR